MNKLSDQELVKMINQGNNALNKAMEYILNSYGDKVKNYLLTKTHNREEAEDALYEGVAALIMNLRRGSFKGESAISSYLTSICKNIWFKKFKRMMLHKNWEEGELAVAENKYEDNVITNDLKQGLDILMSTVKEKCRKVLRLWAMSYSMEEIANKLGMSSPQVVMNKKNLCLKEIRNQLAAKPQLASLIR